MEIQEGGAAQLLNHIPSAFARLVPEYLHSNAFCITILWFNLICDLPTQGQL